MTGVGEWRKTDDSERETVDRIVKAARDAMQAAGFDARNPRFPFVMHHEFYRSRLRRKDFRPRHADVALLLNLWACRQDSFAEAYAWQAVAGAAASLAGRTGRELPEEIKNGCLKACGSFSAFETWAKARLASGP